MAAAAEVAVIAVATVEVVAMVVDQARVVAVAGATGLVGQAVLAALSAADANGTGHPARQSGKGGSWAIQPSSAVHVLHALGRRAPPIAHLRVHAHAVDFSAMPALPPIDDVYITLGTTMAAAGSQRAFRAVDYDAVMATARAARAAGATRCGVVTAMGAKASSAFFYNRVKGEVERDLEALGFTTLVIAQPSLLLGERAALQQAPRAAESLSMKLFQWADPVIPAAYCARPAVDVARALVRAVQTRGAGIFRLRGSDLDPF